MTNILNFFKPKFTVEFQIFSEDFANDFFCNSDVFFKNKMLNLECKNKFFSASAACEFIDECILFHLNDSKHILNAFSNQDLIISVRKGKEYFATVFYDHKSRNMKTISEHPEYSHELTITVHFV